MSVISRISLIRSIKAAEKHRAEYPAGAIVMFRGKCAGWMDRLRDPGHWAPGCIAVLEDGSAYVARGGNSYDGAQEWAPAIHRAAHRQSAAQASA